jgi:hypothetical protein
MRRGVDVPEFEAVSRNWLEAQNNTTKKKLAQENRFLNNVLKPTFLEYELVMLPTQSVQWL